MVRVRWMASLLRREQPKPIDAVQFVQALERGGDRYRTYDEVRAQGTIVTSDHLPLYLTADYATSVDILRDGRFAKEGSTRQSAVTRNSPLFGSMLFVAPPQHTRLRRLASQAFTPAAVQQLEAAVEKIAHRLVDNLATMESVDLMRDYAGPLPRMVIGEVLGISEEDIAPLARAGQVVGAALDGALSSVTDEAIQAASAELRAFFIDLFEERRRLRGNDLLQRLIDAHEADDRLDHDELMSMCCLLLFAGY